MKKRASCKSGPGGRALLTGLARYGRFGRIMRVFYQGRSGHPYHFSAGQAQQTPASAACALTVQWLCGFWMRHRRMLWRRHCRRPSRSTGRRLSAVAPSNESLKKPYKKASLAARRCELVDLANRHVARALETRWNTALGRVEQRFVELNAERASRPAIDRATLLALTQNLPAVWRASSTNGSKRSSG